MIWKARYSVATILFAAYLLCYLDRMAIASAIPFIARDFNLSPLSMGVVLSAFFLGYSVMQIPGGLLVDRFGPNRVMPATILCWSIFTAMTGLAGSLTTMLVIRVLFGMSEGPFPPTASKVVTTWFPRSEVGRANGLQLASVQIGAAFAPLLVTQLVAGFGWRSVFYTLLVPGVILAFVARSFIKDSPGQSKRVSREELTEFGDLAPDRKITRAETLQVLAMPAIMWCCLTLFLTSLASWSLTNWLPTYLLEARGFSVPKMGVFASLPFIAGAIGYYAGGHLSDKYFSERRRIPILIGLVLGAAMTYLAAIASSGEWAVACLALAFLFLYIASAGILTLPLVLVPREVVGVAFGLVNTAAQLAAFLSPLLVGYILNTTNSNFAFVFYCIVGVFLVAACSGLQIKQLGVANPTVMEAPRAR